jgi:hypothetical protein
MLSSIIRRADRFSALCDHCEATLERSGGDDWARAQPLIFSKDRAG